ncbi:TonB-dependent receptor [Hellea sp.]|nr:TonB-dependent receptor [Hellea sp.]
MKLLLSAAMFTTFAASSTAVHAQNSDALEDEIIAVGQHLYSDRINALKTPTPILDVPQSLSIITAEDIQDQGFDSIGDIVLFTPGLTQSQGEGHRDSVVFRGIRSTADFFIDGVRDDVQYFRGLYNLEQVEVLRGPNALFFGRGGTGGVINRVTKKGQISENFIGYSASIDTFSAVDISADANYAINDRAAFRVNANYASLNNQRDFYDGDRYGINPTLHLDLTPGTTLDVSYEYANHERFIDRGIPSLNGEPAFDLVDITFGDPVNNFTTLEANILNATLQHQFTDNIKGNLTSFYGDYNKVYSNFFPSDVFNVADNAVELDGYIDSTNRERFLLSGSLVGEFKIASIDQTIIVGGEYINTSSDQNRFNSVFDSNGDDQEFIQISDDGFFNFFNGSGFNRNGVIATSQFTDLNDDTDVDIDVFSAYIQNEIHVTDWLDIVLGGRFDSFDITVDNVATFIETGENNILSRTDSKVSPRLGIVFKPRENISLYGSFSETFLPRSGEQFANINPPNDALDPNTSQNIEVGLKWNFTNQFGFTIAAFDIENSSPLPNDDDTGTLDIIDSNVRGFEAQLQGDITDQWYVSLGYSLINGNQVDILTDANGNETLVDATNTDGERLRLRELPKNTFNAWSHYQITEKFGLGFGVTYQDESFAGNNNEVTLPSFTRVDAAAFYDVHDDLRLQVNIENLTDTEYFPNAHTNNNITVGQPINAKFTVSGGF